MPPSLMFEVVEPALDWSVYWDELVLHFRPQRRRRFLKFCREKVP